jgi:glycine cleavage system H protein
VAYPTDRKYTRNHEWILPVQGSRVRVGLTEYAAKLLGDIVAVDNLPSVGTEVTADDPFGTVESVKAVSEINSPVDGKVVAINDDVNNDPEQINSDPHAAWIMEIEMSNTKQVNELLTAAQYQAYIDTGGE